MADKNLDGYRKINRLIRHFRTGIDPLVPSQVMQAFMAVAMNEGQTLTEIAEELGTNLSTASRQLLDLGERNRKMEKGYMLVERRTDPLNLRINRYTLTPKGRLLAHELLSILEE